MRHVREEHRAPVHELGKLVHLGQRAAVDEVRHPRRRLLARAERELDLQDGVRKSRLLGAMNRKLGVAIPTTGHLTRGATLGVLRHHRQRGVEGASHRRVVRHLEGGAHVDGAEHGLELFGLHRALHLVEELLDAVQLRVGHRLATLLRLYLGLGAKPLFLFVPGVLPAQKRNDELRGEDEPLLHALLPRPAVAMRLALDEHLSVLGIRAVPSQTHGDGVRVLGDSVVVQTEVHVVEVHGGRHLGVSRHLRRRILLSLHEEHREVLRDGLLDARDVFGGDPVLAGGADEVLHAGAALGPGSLRLAAPRGHLPSKQREEIGDLHHEHGAVILANPGLVVKSLEVIAAARRRGDELVVLLEDLVHGGGVEIGKLLDAQKVILHGVERVAEILDRLDGATVKQGIGLDVQAEVLIAVRGGAGGVEEFIRVAAGSVRGEVRKALAMRLVNVDVELRDARLERRERILDELAHFLDVLVERLEERGLPLGGLPGLGAGSHLLEREGKMREIFRRRSTQRRVES